MAMAFRQSTRRCHATFIRFITKRCMRITAAEKRSNNEVLSEPYPSFLQSIDSKSAIIQQRRHVLQCIQDTNHSDNVISIIRKQYQDDPELLNSAIFSTAVKKCNELHQSHQCVYLMNLMYELDIKRDLIQYNTVLLSLSKCGDSGIDIKQALQYLSKLVNMDKLSPDIYTLTHLLQCFRNHAMKFSNDDLSNEEMLKQKQKMISKCEKVWHLLVHNCDIKADRIAFCEKALFYANYNEPTAAVAIWHDMASHNFKPRVTTCGLIINAFAKFADYESCERIHGFMRKHDMRMNEIILCSLMKCYYNAHLYNKAIELFDKFVIHNRDNKDFNDIDDLIVDGNDILFDLKAKCFVRLLEAAIESNDKTMVRYHMDHLHESIPYQRTECNLPPTNLTLADVQLKTKILTNGENYSDPALKQFFERKMKEKTLWCIRKNHQTSKSMDDGKFIEISDGKRENELLVGVHLYSRETAKFILQYVFENKLNDGTFKPNTIIPIIIGKSLPFQEVRNVLIGTKVPFADLRLDPHNAGKVFFERVEQ